MCPEASPIEQKDLGALHIHKNPLPELPEARTRVSLLSRRRLPGTGGVVAEASPEELGDILSLSLTQLCLLLISRIMEMS